MARKGVEPHSDWKIFLTCFVELDSREAGVLSPQVRKHIKHRIGKSLKRAFKIDENPFHKWTNIGSKLKAEVVPCTNQQEIRAIFSGLGEERLIDDMTVRGAIEKYGAEEVVKRQYEQPNKLYYDPNE